MALHIAGHQKQYAPGPCALANIGIYDSSRGMTLASIDCVVDTGSVYTILPLSLAVAAGITPSGKKISIRPITGVPVPLVSETLDLTVEGQYLLPGVLVLFSSASGFTPVFGLEDAKNSLDFGFDFQHWHFQ